MQATEASEQLSGSAPTVVHEDDLLGTLITGAPRSGTTLALRVLCKGLTPEETGPGSSHQEPFEFWEWCLNWSNPARDIPTEINSGLPALVKRSRHRVIKSPHITPWFSFLEPRYHIILTFRDLRLIVASMLNHEPTRQMGLIATPYWAPMLRSKQDVGAMNHVQRALASARLFVACGLDYRGKMDVWNYGFWDEWPRNNKSIADLYPHPWFCEAIPRVIDDVVNNGMLFSNKAFALSIWEQACEKFKITNADAEAVCVANRELVQLYRARGFNAKTLDDKGSSMVEQAKPPSITSEEPAAAQADDPDVDVPGLSDTSELTKSFLACIEETWGKPEYPTDWIKLPSQRRWEYEITARLLDMPAGARVLDAGGGGGYMSYILSDSYDVTFNDRHDCYKQPPAPVQKIIGSFFTLPEDELFDAIVFVSVLEHVPPERRLDWFKKTRSLLKPGGVAVFTFEWHDTEAFDIGDGIIITTPELTKLFAEIPLKVVEQLVSPTRATNSRGWIPIAVKLVRERKGEVGPTGRCY